MDSLRRQLLLSDFTLLIIYTDDKSVKRKKSIYVARDNVILELGMFVGALDLHRGFYLVVTVLKNGVAVTLEFPSDLEGLTRFDIDLIDDRKKTSLQNNDDSIEQFCSNLKKSITLSLEIFGVDLLPSTPLAIGYFNNLVFHVCDKLSQTIDFKLNNKKYNLVSTGFEFIIILPENNNASHAGFQKSFSDYHLKNIPIKSFRGARKFSIMVDPNPKNKKIKFYDYATTLLSAMEAVDLAISSRTSKKEFKKIKNREIKNFERTLCYLLDSEKSAGFRDNVSIVTLDKQKKTIK